METLRLTRRDAIVALVGTGAAAALSTALGSCGRRDRALPFEGGLVVPDEALGHRLRSADLFARPAVRRERVGTAILGGGISGLSTAWTLARAGEVDFKVYELEAEPGGTALSGTNDISRYPWGAHYVPIPAYPNPAMEALLMEIGAVTGRDEGGRPLFAEEMLCREPEERLFFGFEWHTGLFPRAGASGRDLTQLKRFETEMAAFAAMRDAKGRRAFSVPTRRSSDDADLLALDRMTMGEWMRSRGFDSPRLLWMADYGCRDDFRRARTGRGILLGRGLAVSSAAQRHDTEGHEHTNGHDDCGVSCLRHGTVLSPGCTASLNQQFRPRTSRGLRRDLQCHEEARHHVVGCGRRHQLDDLRRRQMLLQSVEHGVGNRHLAHAGGRKADHRSLQLVVQRARSGGDGVVERCQLGVGCTGLLQLGRMVVVLVLRTRQPRHDADCQLPQEGRQRQLGADRTQVGVPAARERLGPQEHTVEIEQRATAPGLDRSDQLPAARRKRLCPGRNTHHRPPKKRFRKAHRVAKNPGARTTGTGGAPTGGGYFTARSAANALKKRSAIVADAASTRRDPTCAILPPAKGSQTEAAKYVLYGVRLDTSGSVRDVSVEPLGDPALDLGVNPRLVFNVRHALDAAPQA